MMFRSHKDPLYYDAKANDKILVPVRMVSILANATTFRKRSSQNNKNSCSKQFLREIAA